MHGARQGLWLVPPITPWMPDRGVAVGGAQLRQGRPCNALKNKVETGSDQPCYPASECTHAQKATRPFIHSFTRGLCSFPCSGAALWNAIQGLVTAGISLPGKASVPWGCALFCSERVAQTLLQRALWTCLKFKASVTGLAL